MKVSMHIQPSQYEFIGFEYDSTEGLTDEAIQATIEDFHRSKRQIMGNTGLPERDMNKVIDKMLCGESVEGGIDLWEKMSREQQYATQVIKRGMKRINKE